MIQKIRAAWKKRLKFASVSAAALISEALTESSRRDAEARKVAKLTGIIENLTSALVMQDAREASWKNEFIEREHELAEAKQMFGAGPWLTEAARLSSPESKALREADQASSQGAFGDLELALQNVEWRREVNLSWLEFSRWGIQQIILISRLYYIKNPIIRRLIDVDAYYVFGRGVEVSSPDEAANEVLTEFFEHNKEVLGQIALSEHQKRTNYDGNLFFCFFPDDTDTGQTSVRLIDATEVQDIVTDPDDAQKHWYYRRTWTQRRFDEATGVTQQETGQRWYPALGYDPPTKPQTISHIPVDWDHPVLHRKFGAVGSWIWGCPVIYPALDWAKAARRFLEACATVKAALAQIAMTITTKGGQQALSGIKQQLETTVGPNASLWDQNPTPVNASIFASGPGTVLSAFQTKGAGGDPSEVKEFKIMCAIVIGVPPTFIGDLETGNLATATTLDRPTELNFMHKQEAWREILVTIAAYALKVSKTAASGKLREALDKRKLTSNNVTIREAARYRKPDGTMAYRAAAKDPQPNVIEVKCTFPSIREGDMQNMVNATVAALTLENKGGQIVGIDEKTGVVKLMQDLGIERAEEIGEEMYPDTGKDAYVTKRSEQILRQPIGRALPDPGGRSQLPGGTDTGVSQGHVKTGEGIKAAARRLAEAAKAFSE